MTPEVADKLIARSVVDGSCRRWTGAHNSRGYGLVCFDGGSHLVHRVAYELWVGPIPDGLTIDHVRERGCVHKDCFEPAHLEAVTNAQNTRRSRERITHCPQGHQYTPENTITKRVGDGQRRSCRVCANAARRGRGPQGSRRGRPRAA
jgi:hypothetical protein